MSARNPRVGEIVLFVTHHNAVRPAIVVHVWTDMRVNLQVFLDGENDMVPNDQGLIRLTWVNHGDEELQAGCWWWPDELARGENRAEP